MIKPAKTGKTAAATPHIIKYYKPPHDPPP
jgi:hypothetical protein